MTASHVLLQHHTRHDATVVHCYKLNLWNDFLSRFAIPETFSALNVAAPDFSSGFEFCQREAWSWHFETFYDANCERSNMTELHWSWNLLVLLLKLNFYLLMNIFYAVDFLNETILGMNRFLPLACGGQTVVAPWKNQIIIEILA